MPPFLFRSLVMAVNRAMMLGAAMVVVSPRLPELVGGGICVEHEAACASSVQEPG